MKNEEITVIKLLNKISKNEIVPKQIKYQNTIYIFDETDSTYYDENDKTFFQTYNYKILNDTVEILQEENDEWKVINNIDVLQDILSTNKIEVLIENIGDIQIKINQLIKNQKYLKEKLESKDV